MKECTAQQMLSSAPPEQWGSLLEVLGASFRPIDERVDNDESPCTVTSLLGMIGQEQFEQSATPSVVGATSPQENRAFVGSGGKARARRAQQRALAAGATEQQEDTRDLDDLLRHLGEVPDTKAKKKIKNQVVKQPPLAGVSPGHISVKASAPPTPDTVLPVDDIEVETLLEDSEDDDEWQTVAPLAVRRAMCRAQKEVERREEAEERFFKMEKERKTRERAVNENTERMAREKEKLENEAKEEARRVAKEKVQRSVNEARERAATQEGQRVAKWNFDLAAREEVQVHAIEMLGLIKNGPDCLAKEVTICATGSLDQATKNDDGCTATAEGEHAAKEDTNSPRSLGSNSPRNSMFCRSLSEGARPRACLTKQASNSSDSDAGEDGVAVSTTPFHARPSVASWLGRTFVPQQEPTQASVGQSNSPLASSSRDVARSSSPQAAPKRDVSWHAWASVGTWLGRSSAQEQRRNASQDRQFWPATPDGSPAPCVDYGSQAVVWVPVPMHLLAEVQQVLNK